jgi:hypothetical protein
MHAYIKYRKANIKHFLAANLANTESLKGTGANQHPVGGPRSQENRGDPRADLAKTRAVKPGSR